MKFTEIILGVVVLFILLLVWVNLLSISRAKFSIYMDSLSNDATKMSLYNYSNYLVDSINTTSTGYILYSGDNFVLDTSWQYPYECQLKTWIFLSTNEVYTGIFCEIEFQNEKIYNYSIK